jgi:hypothetical protein
MGLKNYKIQNTKYKQIPNYKLQITNINKPALQLPNSPSPQFPNSPTPHSPYFPYSPKTTARTSCQNYSKKCVFCRVN